MLGVHSQPLLPRRFVDMRRTAAFSASAKQEPLVLICILHARYNKHLGAQLPLSSPPSSFDRPHRHAVSLRRARSAMAPSTLDLCAKTHQIKAHPPPRLASTVACDFNDKLALASRAPNTLRLGRP